MIARWISVLFHPFVMVGVMVGAAAAARQSAGEALRSVATVALFTIVPLAVLMVGLATALGLTFAVLVRRT